MYSCLYTVSTLALLMILKSHVWFVVGLGTTHYDTGTFLNWQNQDQLCLRNHTRNASWTNMKAPTTVSLWGSIMLYLGAQWFQAALVNVRAVICNWEGLAFGLAFWFSLCFKDQAVPGGWDAGFFGRSHPRSASIFTFIPFFPVSLTLFLASKKKDLLRL